MVSRKNKIITLVALLVTMISSVIFVAGATDNTSESYYKVVSMDVSEYRADLTNLRSPAYDEEEGYIFAGWFTDETCEQAIAKDTQTGSAYAKFVPAAILGVKAQVSIELADDDTTNDASGSIRFVTSVDTLKYSEVGFIFERGKGEEIKSSSKVYTELYVTDVNGKTTTKEEKKPSDVFHSASAYFKAWTYTNVPEGAYNTKIEATPFWVTLDGTTVKATSSVKCVNEGRQWKYIFVDDTGSDVTGTGTRTCPYATLNGALAHIATYGVTDSYGNNKEDGQVLVLTLLTAGSDFAWAEHGLDVTIGNC